MKFLETPEEKKSFGITTAFFVVLFILFAFFGLTYLDPPPENGIAVNFGTSDTGSGDIQPIEPPKTTQEEAQSEPEASEEQTLTQDADAPVTLPKTEKKKPVTKPAETKPTETPKKKVNSALDKIKKPTHYLLSYDYREKKSGISRILDGIDPEKKIKLPDHLDHHTRLLMITRARMCAMFVQKLLINYTTGPPINIFKFATAILSRRRLPPPPRENTLQGHSDFIFSLAFHPTAPLLATGGRDKTAKLWHLSSDNSSVTCLATLGGHRDSVNSVAFHPTAPLLATGSYDGTAKLWRLSSDNSSATCVATLEGHSGFVNCVAFHATVPLLATGSGDKTDLRLWVSRVGGTERVSHDTVFNGKED